jgi:Ca2+-binding EF-hand superfamily protein
MSVKFKECDADNSGLVSLDEAKNILKQSPFNFPDEKVKLAALN